MDDIKKKRIEKTTEIISNVEDNFSKALKQRELLKLIERRTLLQGKIASSSTNGVDRANAKLQLKDIERSITALEESGVNLTDQYDTDVDEAAARKFLSDNNLEIEYDEVDIIKQNDILDELEQNLGVKDESECGGECQSCECDE